MQRGKAANDVKGASRWGWGEGGGEDNMSETAFSYF